MFEHLIIKMSDEKLNYNLPLVSNINDILVTHYIFNFSCDFSNKHFDCDAIYFLQPVNNKCTCKDTTIQNCNEDGKSEFILVLDCHRMLIKEVKEISVPHEKLEALKFNSSLCILNYTGQNLNFIAEEWSLKIWKRSSYCQSCFPKVIKISYETLPNGQSLLWTPDQNGIPTVFIYGDWINNRSLFPCQEPPSAMATWEARVIVPESYTVLMSGDEEAFVFNNDGKAHYYYSTKKILPLSTLALAIGCWQQYNINNGKRASPKCRIFAPYNMFTKVVEEFSEIIPLYIHASEEILGTYPFPRIDFLLVPRGFGSLGMASPNMIYLSQSLLAGDCSMSSRLAHEIAHAWFGLLIGANDWSEEWLSEGFATFLEDYIHIKAVQMPHMYSIDYLDVKNHLRLKTLMGEIENTDQELQILRPNKGEIIKDIVDSVEAIILKNGQNPIKAFTQVHYIKGYFLLKYLSEIIGFEEFIMLLKDYVQQYNGQLVESKVFLMMFFQRFPNLENNISLEKVYEDWLHNPGINHVMQNIKPHVNNAIFQTAFAETKKWKTLNKLFLQRGRKRKKYSTDHFLPLNPEQKLLVLENLLEEKCLAAHTIKFLNEIFNIKNSNAEIQHRWCELVVKHQYKPGYTLLENFLLNHLAMGVYLYGEMIFSNSIQLKQLAEKCFALVKSEMEPNYVSTISQMLKDAQI